MEMRRLTDQILVAGQITPADVEALAGQGVRAIINNRPDGEAADQPSIASIEQAAAAHGVAFVSIPFRSGQQTMDDVVAFANALNALDKPMLIYCRTGTRSTSIWAMAEAGKRPVDDILGAAAAAGYDLSPMRQVLEMLAAQASQSG